MTSWLPRIKKKKNFILLTLIFQPCVRQVLFISGVKSWVSLIESPSKEQSHFSNEAVWSSGIMKSTNSYPLVSSPSILDQHFFGSGSQWWVRGLWLALFYWPVPLQPSSFCFWPFHKWSQEGARRRKGLVLWWFALWAGWLVSASFHSQWVHLWVSWRFPHWTFAMVIHGATREFLSSEFLSNWFWSSDSCQFIGL